MTLCKNMVGAFEGHNGRVDAQHGELFSNYDLQFGEVYARDLLAEGYERDPMDGFDLKQFAAWCKRMRR